MRHFLCAGFIGVFVGGVTPRQQAAPIERARFMAGCWEQRMGTRTALEMWMAPAGSLMMGASRTLVSGAAREYEHLRISELAGALVYTAIPSGQKEAAFTSTQVSDTMIVFENLQHDFPQRIIYRKRGADSLVARIEGPGQGGTTRGIDYPMKRTACSAP